MPTFSDQMVEIFDRYLEEAGSEPASLDDVADWALPLGLYRPMPRDIRKMFKEAMAESLRQEKRHDGKRWYRAKHSVRTNIAGRQMSLWADIDKDLPRSFMEKSAGQRRKGVANDCFWLKMDVDHWNERNPDQPAIPLILDFTDDVAEMEAAGRGGSEDDDAG